jgi:hypothetical protein
MFKITFTRNAKQFAATLKVIATFVKKTNIVFKQNTILIERLSDVRTGYVIMEIHDSDYIVEGFPEGRTEIPFGVELKHLIFGIKNVTTLVDVIVMEFNDDCTEMNVISKTKKEETSMMLQTEVFDDILLNIPADRVPSLIVDIPSKDLDDKIKTIRNNHPKCDKIIFKLDNSSLVMYMDDAPEDATFLPVIAHHHTYEPQLFSMRFFENYVKPTLAKKVRIELFDKFPLRVTYPLMSPKSYLLLHLACCVDDA